MISYTLEVALLLWQKFYNFFNNLVVNIKYWFIFALALGRLAQLVQSTSFTPRGSGVRTPHRPQKLLNFLRSFFILKQ